MTTHAHQQLCSDIARLDTCPEDENEFARWCRASGHLELLARNCGQDELIIAAYGPYTYLRSLFVNRTTIDSTSPDTLLEWQPHLSERLVSYSWVHPDGPASLAREYSAEDQQFLSDAESPIFWRTIDGVNDQYSSSWEPRQEYLHAVDAHWRPDRKAYSKIDRSGDWLDLICVTAPKFDEVDGITLVSFQRDALDQYLAIRDMVVVQMFDFTLYRKPFGTNSSWDVIVNAVLCNGPNRFSFGNKQGRALSVRVVSRSSRRN